MDLVQLIVEQDGLSAIFPPKLLTMIALQWVLSLGRKKHI